MNGNAKAREETRKAEDARQRTSPSSKVVHQAILREGSEELERPSTALFWSALAAGLSMSLSVITEALIRAHLPDVAWRPLVVKFGYPMGFLAAIFGRQQLFTENTLTAVLPVMQSRELSKLVNLALLWAVVLAGNMAGCLLAAMGLAWTDAFDHRVRAAFLEIGHEALTVVRGIVAGWTITLIVWVLPFAEAGPFFIIVALTYVVGLGGLTHVVAGSLEAFIVAASGQQMWLGVFGAYTGPLCLGTSSEESHLRRH